MNRTQVRQGLRKCAATVLRHVVFPGRDRAFRLVESALGPNPGSFIVPLRGGGKLLVDGVKDSYIFYLGDFQWNVYTFLRRTVQSRSTVFDLGANIGSYTIPLALRAGRVYAFEAFKPNFDILLKNVALNGLTNVTAIFGAVADSTGTRLVPDRGGRSDNIGNYSLASKTEGEIEIPSWSLDDFAAQHNVEEIDLMKIDIEGSEIMALRGARRLFSQRKVKTVICEFNPYWLRQMGSSTEELYDMFHGFGLKSFLVTRFARLKSIDKEFCKRATSDEFDVVWKQ